MVNLSLWLKGTTKKLSSGWASKWIAFAALSIYLACEVLFNSLLIDVSTGRGPDTINFSDVELIGRALSSTGLCIFVYKFLKTPRLKLIATPFIWIGFFILMKVVVWVVVETSSAPQRQAAFRYLSIVSVSDNLPAFREYGASSLVERALIPSFMYYSGGNDNEMALTLLKSNKENVFNTAAFSEQAIFENKVKAGYSDYVKSYEYLQDLFTKYQYAHKASNQLAIDAWNAMYKGHKMIRAVQLRIEGNASLIDVIGPDLSSLVREAHDTSCQSDSLNSKYIMIVNKTGKLKRHLKNTSLCDWVDSSGSKAPYYADDKEYYMFYLLKILTAPHRVIRGVDYTFSLFKNVLSQPELQDYLTKDNPSCTDSPLVTFKDFQKYLAICQLKDTPENTNKISLLKIERGLNYYEFIKDKNLHNFIESSSQFMAPSLVEKMTSTDPNYYNRAIYPAQVNRIKVEYNKRASSLGYGYFTNAKEFSNGGLFYEHGKNSYRYITILPVVLALNLLFTMITLVILTYKALCLFTQSMLLSYMGTICFASLLITLPVLRVSNEGLSSNSLMLEWLIGVQPVIYELARTLF